MSNKDLTPPATEVVLARLKVLFENVNQLYKAGLENNSSSAGGDTTSSMVLESDLISSYHTALNLFFDSLDGSVTSQTTQIYAGAPSDPIQYNLITSAINKDMEALFAELGAVDKLIAGSFNSIMSEREQVLQLSKRMDNKLGDYLLYADPSLGGGFFFGDSFNTGDRIDVGSDLVEGDECYLGMEEGVVLLPFEGEPERPSVKSIIINKTSNGTKGNNNELGVHGHDALEVISDGEPNTWFEYEKVSVGESDIPLVLDLIITFNDLSVINHININPINFGTSAPIKIIELETSKDGLEYVSIKDDVPLKDFVVEEDKDEFSLSAATSKHAGQGFYSFLPRKAQYVHVLFKQYAPYPIQTNNGTRLRYAIGLRDINIFGRKFKPEGSIVSSPFSINGDARKVSLWASENPTEVSVLADITHSISYDDGSVWNPIQPQGRDGFDIPEIINFNNIAEGSISTEEEVDSLRHKITMTRDKDKFSGNVTLSEKKISQVDILNAPSGGSFTLPLSQPPIKDTIRLVLPFWGSYSCPRPRRDNNVLDLSAPMDLDFIRFSVDAAAVDTLRYPLPFKNIPDLEDKIRVFVNGAQWEWAGKSLGFLTAELIDSNSKVYFLNNGGKELQFGYSIGDTDYGHIPSGAKIEVCLDGDNPFLTLTDQGYVLSLSSSSDGFKENMELFYYDALDDNEAYDYEFKGIIGGEMQDSEGYSASLVPAEQKESFLKVRPPVFLPGAANIEMKEYQEEVLIVKASRRFNEPVAFVDGNSELIGPYGALDENRYSFDPDTQRIFTGSTPPIDRQYTLVVKAIDAEAIPVDKWEYYRDLAFGQVDTQKIIIDPTYVSTVKREKEYDFTTGDSVNHLLLLPEAGKGHDWKKQRLVKGTVIPNPSLFPSTAEPTEVPFVNGRDELQNLILIKKEPITFSGPVANIYSFTLQELTTAHPLAENTSLGFATVRDLVSSTANPSLFLEEVPWTVALATTDLDTNGQWRVNRTTGLVDLYYAGSLYTHTVTYTYQNIDSGINREGQYSVDYKTGLIYFAQPIEKTGSVLYESSLYSAFYNIGEIIKDTDIEEIDEEGQSVTLSAALGMRFLKLNTADKARPAFLKAMYEYYERSTESLEDLEPYFSPICKDIAFRAVTSDTLEELPDVIRNNL